VKRTICKKIKGATYWTKVQYRFFVPFPMFKTGFLPVFGSALWKTYDDEGPSTGAPQRPRIMTLRRALAAL
jgi:hypothetical protein